MDFLTRRHIQNMSDAASLEHHWGYADRAIPCKNDAGSCEYLDVVYHSHDLGMMYAGIFWASIGGILLVWAIVYRMRDSANGSDAITQDSLEKQSPASQGSRQRLLASLKTVCRRYLSPDCLRPIFGHVTRLQVLTFAVLAGYLTIWTFVGIVYKRWITPVKNSDLHNTRSSLGPFADRVGLLAYALIPLTVMLSSRESVLSLITGIPYQSFNFLHRWLGYIIFAQSVLHTVGWTIIEVRLYQPQPTTAREWIKQKYMIWGIVAQIFITFLFVSSIRPVIRLTGYEFFRKAHYVVAMLFIGACWGHWSKLSCFMIASLALWFIDRAIRLVRTALLHYNYLPNGSTGFTSASAKLQHFPDAANGDVVRLDFEHDHDPWTIGQHFYLCFPELSIWQSHPFTPMSLPQPGGRQNHTYIIRAKQGATRDLANLAASKSQTSSTIAKPPSPSLTNSSPPHHIPSAPVLLTGPYNPSLLPHLPSGASTVFIAGGTGITYVLPLLLHLTTQPLSPPHVSLTWYIRTLSSLSWIRPELARLRSVDIHIFITRETHPTSSLKGDTSVTTTDLAPSTTSVASVYEVTYARPSLQTHVPTLVSDTDPSTIFASGPPGMLAELRGVAARLNRPHQVWRGDRGGEVKLVVDERGEW